MRFHRKDCAVSPARLRRKGDYMTKKLKKLWNDESAVGVVEIILILVVLIALVVIFREQLTDLVGNIFSSINSKAGTVYN